MNRQALLAWLIIGTTIGSFFGPAVIAGRPLAFRDSAHFYYPLFQWCREEWGAGRVPLWNPAENCGNPILADATSSVFYPGKLLFALPIDYGRCFNLYLVLHVVLAAAATYSLARAWRASHAAATLAAITYACGGSVVFQYCNVAFLVGAAWLPFCFLAADRMLRRRRWTDSIVLGVMLALMTLGGDPQAVYHGLLITILCAAILGWQRWQQTSGAIFEAGSLLYAKPFALIAVAACLAFGLSAVQILPSLEATRGSERAAFNRPRNVYEATTVALQAADVQQPRNETRTQSIVRGLFGEPEGLTHHEAIYEFSIGPWRLAEFLWPNLGGRMFPIHRRWFSLLPGEGRVWTPTLYLGLLPALLAIGSFVTAARNGRTRWLKWLAVLGVVGSFGFYGIGWLLHEVVGLLPIQQSASANIGNPVGGLYWLLVTLLPGYTYFRYPAKLLPVAALAICLLGAKSLDRVFARRESWATFCLGLLATLSGACALAIWLLGNRLLTDVASNDAVLGPFDALGARHDLLFALLHSMLTAILLGTLTYVAARSQRKMAWYQWLAVALTAVDIWLANAWTVVSVSPEILHGEVAIASETHGASNRSGLSTESPRIFRGNLASWRPSSFRKSSSQQRLAELTQWERATLLPRFQLGQGIALVESHGSIFSADYQAFLHVAKQHGPRQRDKSLTPQPAALRLLGTQYLILPESHQVEFATRVDHQSENWPEDTTLWRMNRSFPRAWIVHRVESLPPSKGPLRKETLEERAREVLFPQETARDLSRSAVVETDHPLAAWSATTAQSRQASNYANSRDNCQIIHDDPQRIVVHAELDEPGLLVLADAWYPGWQAVVKTDRGTHPATIYRTNRVLRGVWLEAGQQTIEFCYRPVSFYIGAAVSGSSWLILAIAGLLYAVKRRQPQRS